MPWDDASALERFGVPASAWNNVGSFERAGVSSFNRFQRFAAEKIEGARQLARELQHSCKPRNADRSGGCWWPKSIWYNDKRGETQRLQLPDNVCPACIERATRYETALIMCEVSGADEAMFLTVTYSNPASDDELRGEAEADACDDSLSSYEREWRALNRAVRMDRAVDRAHEHLFRQHASEFRKRLRQMGIRQGNLAVARHYARERMGLMDAAVAEAPRRDGETLRAYGARVASIRRGVRASIKAARDNETPQERVKREWMEADIRAREGFTCNVWVAGHYGGKTDRAHWHLIVTFCGTPPRSWPRPTAGVKRRKFAHILQWPHGHTDMVVGVDEKSARYVSRYALSGLGRVKGVSEEKPAPVHKSHFYDYKLGAWKRRGLWSRPRNGAMRFCYALGEHWAKAGFFPADFTFCAPGCRDQRPRYEVVGSRNAPGGDNRRSRKVHNGRASRLAGPHRRASMQGFCDMMGIRPSELPSFADRRDEFCKASVEKWMTYEAKRDERRFPDLVAFDERREVAALDRFRMSEATARDFVADERDFFRVRSAEADELARDLSGQRFRAMMPGWRVVSSPEQVAAFAAHVALAASGQLVWQEGAWVDLRAPP